jgi:hypothetical protein
MPSPFNTSLRRDPSQPGDLSTRIDAQIRERLEEAVDFVCLEVMVERRRARGLSAPAADNEEDRTEFTTGVRAFLEHLEADLTPDLAAADRRRVLETARATDDPTARLLTIQVGLAKLMPDYWQRFEASRSRYAVAPGGETSGRDRGSLLRRLFGLGA